MMIPWTIQFLRYKQMHPEFNKTLKKQRKLKPMVMASTKPSNPPACS